MRIAVTGLKREVGLQASHSFEFTADPSFDDAGTATSPWPIEVEALLTNTGEGIVAEVRLRGRARLRCSRCLEEFEVPLETEFEVEFREGAVDDSGEKEIASYSGEYIDLSDEIRQNLLLALPMRPLCSEACRGLCPTCGKNLNTGDCACGPGITDIRMAALENWASARKGQGSES